MAEAPHVAPRAAKVPTRGDTLSCRCEANELANALSIDQANALTTHRRIGVRKFTPVDFVTELISCSVQHSYERLSHYGLPAQHLRRRLKLSTWISTFAKTLFCKRLGQSSGWTGPSVCCAEGPQP